MVTEGRGVGLGRQALCLEVPHPRAPCSLWGLKDGSNGRLNPQYSRKGNLAKRLDLGDSGFSLFRHFLTALKGCLASNAVPNDAVAVFLAEHLQIMTAAVAQSP